MDKSDAPQLTPAQEEMLRYLSDPWWRARAKGRRGRSKPGRKSRGYQSALWKVLMDAKRAKMGLLIGETDQ